VDKVARLSKFISLLHFTQSSPNYHSSRTIPDSFLRFERMIRVAIHGPYVEPKVKFPRPAKSKPNNSTLDLI